MNPWQKVILQDVVDGYSGLEVSIETLDKEAVIDFMPNGSIEELCVLQHPVFPHALPVELKGIAV